MHERVINAAGVVDLWFVQFYFCGIAAGYVFDLDAERRADRPSPWRW